MPTGAEPCSRARLTSPVVQPLNPEAPVGEAAVADIEPFTWAVPSGPNDADEATSTLAASATTDRLGVVSKKVRPRVHEPRKAVVAPAPCQETKDVALSLATRNGRLAECCRLRRRDESDGHYGDLDTFSRHTTGIGRR